MARTTRSNVFYPQILEKAISAGFSGIALFNGIGAATLKSGLLSTIKGDTVTIPYFGTVGEFDDITNDGDALPLTGFDQSTETATVQHSGKFVEMTRFAQNGVEDPYAEVGKQMAEAAQRRFDKALIDQAVLTPLVKTYTSSDTLDLDKLTDARALWGDESDDICGLVVHSKTEASLRKLKSSTGIPLLLEPQGEGKMPTVNGLPVFVSDRMPVTDGVAGSVTSAGTSPPTLTVTVGTIAGVYDVRVKVTLAGARGTAKIKYSVDGGANWSDETLTAATVEMFGPYTKQTTGVTLNFANTSFSLDNTYQFDVTALHTSLLVRRGAMSLWYSDPFVSTLNDPSRDTEQVATHVYYTSHLYRRMPGRTKPGVVKIRHGV